MIDVPLQGGDFAFKVIATRSECEWQVDGAPSWVRLHDKGGRGTGAVAFTVERLGDGKRSDAIVVNRQSVTVVQHR